MNKKTIQELIHHALNTYTQSTAIEYGARRVSYEQLDRLSATVCQWLLSRGVRLDNFIGIYTPDRVQLIIGGTI